MAMLPLLSIFARSVQDVVVQKYCSVLVQNDPMDGFIFLSQVGRGHRLHCILVLSVAVLYVTRSPQYCHRINQISFFNHKHH
jgi:hypothetical protein